MPILKNKLFVTSSLWLAQVLLAILFLMSGFGKLFATDDVLAEQFPRLAPSFMRFIGALEVLGAVGLILPSLLRLWPALTPLAAGGLLIIMIAATVYTVANIGADMAVLPLIAAVLSAFVAYGRCRLAPIQGRSRSAGARPGGRYT